MEPSTPLLQPDSFSSDGKAARLALYGGAKVRQEPFPERGLIGLDALSQIGFIGSPSREMVIRQRHNGRGARLPASDY